MKLDNLSIAYLLLELNPLIQNSFVNKVSEISSGVIKIKLHTKQGSKDLILPNEGFFISNYSIPARHGKTTFAAVLRKELYNKKIVSLEQHLFDRVVEIKFFEHSLVLEFIGDGNKILCSNDRTIISCLRNEKWSEREIKKGLKYVPPKPQGMNPTTIDASQLEKEFENSKKEAIKEIIYSVNISPLIAEEVFHAMKIEKNKKANSLSKNEIQKIISKIKEFYSPSSEKFKPVAYKAFPYPFPLFHLNEKPVQIESLNPYLSESLSAHVAAAPKQKEGKETKEKLSGLEYQKKVQVQAREKFSSQIDENKNKAELIYENYPAIEELRSSVQKALAKGLKEKEILLAFSEAAKRGNKWAAFVKKIDLKKKQIELEL